MKQSVGILLTNAASTGIWLSRRIAPGDVFFGYQATPGGGVEEGENLVAAIVRELREETGIDWCGEFSLTLLITGQYVNPKGETYEANHFILKTDLAPQNTEDKKHGPWTFYEWKDLESLVLMPSTIDAIKVAREAGYAKWRLTA